MLCASFWLVTALHAFCCQTLPIVSDGKYSHAWAIAIHHGSLALLVTLSCVLRVSQVAASCSRFCAKKDYRYRYPGLCLYFFMVHFYWTAFWVSVACKAFCQVFWGSVETWFFQSGNLVFSKQTADFFKASLALGEVVPIQW